MSTSNLAGVIKNFSPKPDKDHYGILLDTGKRETWLNGQDDIPDHLEKEDKVKVKANLDEFVEIEEIDVMEPGKGSSEGSQGSSDLSHQASDEGDKSGSEPLSKDEKISRKVAFKEAAETVRERSDTELGTGQLVQEVSDLANGYLRILQDMGDEE